MGDLLKSFKLEIFKNRCSEVSSVWRGALSLSIAIHFILVFFLWTPQELPKNRPIEISMVTKIFEKTKKFPLRNSLSPSLSQKILAFHTKPNFEKAFSAKDFSGEASDDTENYLKNSSEDNPLADWGSGGGTFARTKDYLLFDRIYHNIDSILYYSGVLARHKIQGYINTRLVLDSNGKCEWKFTQIKGADPYLRLFILDILKQACGQNYSRYINARNLTNVDMSFKFALTEHDNKNWADHEKGIVGNTLLFYRNTQNSIMEWELGPFRGMFPIPAVYLNIPWIQENWEQIIYHRDPLEVFKQQFGKAS